MAPWSPAQALLPGDGGRGRVQCSLQSGKAQSMILTPSEEAGVSWEANGEAFSALRSLFSPHLSEGFSGAYGAEVGLRPRISAVRWG